MEKQIIEMSEEILQEYTNCYSEADQKCLEKMLRKLAFDVAEEIFAEIDTSLSIADFKGGEVYYAIRAEDYLHYKKKYIGKDTNVTTESEDTE